MKTPELHATPIALLAFVIFLQTQFPTFCQTNQSFDGRPWNVSSGNLSVSYIQGSPIGAYPKTNYLEPAPSVESQKRLKSLGLVANEDYVAWGSVEQVPGRWDWKQHDAVEKNLHEAGLNYVVYDWVHFPPVWLRDQQKEKRTLMRCLEHGKEANYLSIFDPRTVEWYDHFYKNLKEHFGDKIDDVYACILGPYGEGNYPLMVPDWVNMGHCHEGYWCGDDYAVRAFQTAMKKKYASLRKLNRAWGSNYKTFDEVCPPKEIANEKFKPSPEAFVIAGEKRRWLDFITWYHQAIIDFAEQSIKTALKYFPAEKVRAKPGGNAGGVNPIAWGTYCPGYAKMAGKYGVVLQPADCQGAVFGDKWVGTAYQFYGVKECTEPAGGLDEKHFVRRMFSDASCGAAQLFTYEFEQHATNIQQYIHLFTGKPGETEVAVYCPTTWYRLGGSLQTSIAAGYPLRDLCEFDVLDEILITDGALTTKRYKALVMLQADVVDQPILEKVDAFIRKGGKVIVVGDAALKNVEGQVWHGVSKVKHVLAVAKDKVWLKQLAAELAGCKGVDGQLDGLWTCRRGKQILKFNSTDKVVNTEIEDQAVQVAPWTIWASRK
ncbi:family 14 glycosylhydrolase [Pedosphaera parvula]|uniref:Beta-amylase n=1 Tax=Pedosphaera parvula (strain Ellin514) TaxID=320771 RepID=B9XRR5_PEDPL|nr:family 14 glycosylhydrolase [Pedosphaera parvula]EEF57480.1 glycoside hydrolase family 14 [Pedosphaera parvula Ellin514]